MLALKSGKAFTSVIMEIIGESVTIIACMNTSGRNWIPSGILYSGRQRKKVTVKLLSRRKFLLHESKWAQDSRTILQIFASF